jgi:hypothetical protein
MRGYERQRIMAATDGRKKTLIVNSLPHVLLKIISLLQLLILREAVGQFIWREKSKP